MKKYPTFMLLLVVALAVSVASGSTDGPHIEAFWKILAKGGVKIRRAPVEVPDTKCGAEWVEHGSHCEVSTLTRYAFRENLVFEQKTEKMIARISDISKILVASFDTAVEFQRRFPDAKQKRVAVYAKALASIGANPAFRPALAEFAQQVHVQPMRDCERDMAALRSSGLCSICSGRYKAFLEGDRLTISQEACDQLLSSCVDSFGFLDTFLRAMDTLTAALAQLERRQFLKLGLMKAASDRIKKTIRDIRKDGVNGLLGSYQENQESDTCECGCSEQVVQDLCSKVVTVARQPVYLKFARLFLRIKPKIVERFNTKLQKALEKKQRIAKRKQLRLAKNPGRAAKKEAIKAQKAEKKAAKSHLRVQARVHSSRAEKRAAHPAPHLKAAAKPVRAGRAPVPVRPLPSAHAIAVRSVRKDAPPIARRHPAAFRQSVRPSSLIASGRQSNSPAPLPRVVHRHHSPRLHQPQARPVHVYRTGPIRAFMQQVHNQRHGSSAHRGNSGRRKLLGLQRPFNLPQIPSFSLTANTPFLPKLNFFTGDVKVVSAIDSSYAAHLGAAGSNGNELSSQHHSLPINMTSKFP